ncbi:ComEC/Rec2 family competence protein [Citricoccus sp.]|uniref:ComEC/Rec2 family competence protein n=1 Tax=Citricoccus sp. TaxID=1978372 RepID=UPI002610A723|nr:ComEC/Rec2 family competence protein [Citricoccus sp.]HRO31132.1 ComEC/Rec2 family competence protein [Citricoccus sp.]
MRPPTAGPVPGPVDVRLVPALLLTLVTCLAVPVLPYEWVQMLPWGLGVAAAAVTVLLVAIARSGRVALVSLTALTACALWVAAVAAVQAVGDRAPVKASGWEDAVSAGQPVRLSGRATGGAVRSPGAFGDRWHVTVAVDAFGHPVRTVPEGTEVVVSGDAEWDGMELGTRLCLTADLEPSGTTVFARARTGPDAGSCPDHNGGTGAESGTGGSTGREVVRAAVRDAAAGSVGAAPQLLPGLVLGDRSVQDPELDEAMKASGLSHLSAVSGANCTLLAGAVMMSLRTLRIRRPVVLGAVLGVLVVFVIIVGPEPSVIRAAVMGGIGAWAVFFGRGRQALPLLCLAGCVLLCWKPALAAEPAFQLSLAATAGIVLAARPVEQWLTATLGRILPGPVAGTIGAALAVTVCAQVACQPVLVGIAGTLSSYAVPANLFAAPLVPLITVPGTAAAILAVPLAGLASAVFWLIGWPAAGIGWIAGALSSLPGALHAWPGGVLGAVLVALHVLAALALLWLLLRWERTRPARVRRIPAGPVPRGAPSSRTLRWSLAAAWTLVCAAVGSQLALVVSPPTGPVPRDWSLAACDVGQGDMLVLRTGQRSAMVVDTGPDPGAATSCLRNVGVERIDLLVLSHLHQDHAGSAAALAECCQPAAVVYSSMATPGAGGPGAGDREDRSAAEGAGGARAPAGARRPGVGETGTVGEPASVWRVDWEVLAADSEARDENDASLQMAATVHTPQGSYTVLLTGDMEQEATGALLRQGVFPETVDVLKVSHHGARNGGNDLVRALMPALSVVQVGRENSYGHPHPSVITELQRHGPVVRTDEHGTTVVSLRDGQLVPTVTGQFAPAVTGRAAGTIPVG